MAHYARITGHAPDFIIDGLAQKLSEGLHVGMVNQYEVEFAEMLCDIIPCAEKVRFCCTGTEATMYAIRLARGYTERKVILKIEGGWHGPNSNLIYKINTPLEHGESLGLLPEMSKYTKTIPFNDIKGAIEAIKEDATQIKDLVADLSCYYLHSKEAPLPNWLSSSLSKKEFETRINNNEFTNLVYENNGSIIGYISVNLKVIYTTYLFLKNSSVKVLLLKFGKAQKCYVHLQYIL